MRGRGRQSLHAGSHRSGQEHEKTRDKRRDGQWQTPPVTLARRQRETAGPALRMRVRSNEFRSALLQSGVESGVKNVKGDCEILYRGRHGMDWISTASTSIFGANLRRRIDGAVSRSADSKCQESSGYSISRVLRLRMSSSTRSSNGPVVRSKHWMLLSFGGRLSGGSDSITTGITLLLCVCPARRSA